MDILFFIPPFFVFILHFIIIKWVNELEKEGCGCSNLLDNKYIKYYAIIFFITFILLFFITFFFNILSYMIETLRIISFSIFIIYLSIIIDCIIELKKFEYMCSENWKKKYFYFTIISYLLILLIIIISIFIFYNEILII